MHPQWVSLIAWKPWSRPCISFFRWGNQGQKPRAHEGQSGVCIPGFHSACCGGCGQRGRGTVQTAQPRGLRLTIRCGRQWHSAQARSAGPILPPYSLCQNMQAGSCFFSRFKNIQWTGVYNTVKGGDAEQQSMVPPGRDSRSCLGLAGSQNTSSRNALLWAPTQRGSPGDISQLQVLNSVLCCANKQHQQWSDPWIRATSVWATQPGSLAVGVEGKQARHQISSSRPCVSASCRTVHGLFSSLGLSFPSETEAEAPVFWSSEENSHLIGKGLDAGTDWRQGEQAVAEDDMVGWHQWFNGHEFEQTLGDSEGQGSLACCSPWGSKGSTGQNNKNRALSLFSWFPVYVAVKFL